MQGEQMILKYLCLLPVNLFAALFGYLLAPVVSLFADDSGWLPNWLNWFQTPDNSLDGDKGWQTEHLWIWAPRWINRTRWLWRNNMHGFNTSVLGFTPSFGFDYTFYGKQAVSNRPLVNGYVLRLIKNRNKQRAFQFYYVRKWSCDYCLRINLGWKIWQSPKYGKKSQYVFSINPFMGFRE